MRISKKPLKLFGATFQYYVHYFQTFQYYVHYFQTFQYYFDSI